MATDIKVLERRLVAEGEIGRAEWELVEADDGTSNWFPAFFDTDGKRSNPSPAWLPLPGSQWLFLECPVFECLYEGTRGPGKRILNANHVLTDKGWKQVGSVNMQDLLVAPDGSYTKIQGIFPKENGTIYRVTFEDNSTLDVDGEHLWTVRSAKNSHRDGWIVRSTDELIKLLKQSEGKTRSEKNSWYIPTMSGFAPGIRWDGPDPYVIGQILGDGTMKGQYPTVYSADEWTKDYLQVCHGWRAYKYDKSVYMLQETRIKEGRMWRDSISDAKGAYKSVPRNLRDADGESRLSVLQGLMDSDGSISADGKCRFVSLSEYLAKDVQYLVRSLGGKATCYWEDRLSPKGGIDGRWRVNISHCNKFNPFRLPRKANRIKNMTGTDRRIESIVRIEDGPATCFMVEHPSHLFVCQDFIVTHNTLALLMDFAKDCGKGFGSSWRGILFRREYKDLDDVVKKLEEWMPRLFPGFYFLHSKSDYKGVWPGGEELLLRHLEKEEDYGNYHGHEYPWLGFEELTQWENEKPYLKMQSCCRSTIQNIPFRVRATTNPYGAGHNWVKKRFKLPHMRGKVINLPDQMPRVAIHGSIHENFLLLHAVPQYIRILKQSTSNPAEAKAWIEGDWDVSSGGVFDDLWDNKIHVLPSFGPGKIPHGWTITRSYDHGQSHPFACLWWLESNGEPMEYEGRTIGNVRGDLILWMEWYGYTGEDNVGLKLPARKIARGIMDRENDEGIHRRVRPGPADTEIFNKSSDRLGKCPADDMAEEGILWERADKTPGSRKRGIEMGRTLLQDAKPGADGTREHPGLFICDRCVKWMELVPSAPRDPANPDDTPEKYEDHLIDASRYRWNFIVPRVWASSF